MVTFLPKRATCQDAQKKPIPPKVPQTPGALADRVLCTRVRRRGVLRSSQLTADGGPKTMGAFLTSWLENSVRGSVRKSTYDRNESLCRVHLIPALGRNKLNR